MLTVRHSRQSIGFSRWLWHEITVFDRTNYEQFRLSWLKIKNFFWRRGMSTLALTADERVSGVKVTQDALTVSLMDGRIISVPLAWYPRLQNATAAQRRNWQLAGAGYGIHWPEIDEDLSTEGLLRGAPAPRKILKKSKKKRRSV
jgi:hypothetical protein